MSDCLLDVSDGEEELADNQYDDTSEKAIEPVTDRPESRNIFGDEELVVHSDHHSFRDHKKKQEIDEEAAAELSHIAAELEDAENFDLTIEVMPSPISEATNKNAQKENQDFERILPVFSPRTERHKGNILSPIQKKPSRASLAESLKLDWSLLNEESIDTQNVSKTTIPSSTKRVLKRSNTNLSTPVSAKSYRSSVRK